MIIYLKCNGDLTYPSRVKLGVWRFYHYLRMQGDGILELYLEDRILRYGHAVTLSFIVCALSL